MTTRIEEYVKALVNQGENQFVGAYNMGVWGVSVSDKGPMPLGLSACGTAVVGAPRFSAQNRAQNWVKYYDTPNLWGYGGEDKWKDVATTQKVQTEMNKKAAWSKLCGRWESVITQSEQLVDVTSLSPPVPGHEAEQAICNGIEQCIKNWLNGQHKPKLMIRLLFGMTATNIGKANNTEWLTFMTQLKKKLAPLAGRMPANTELPTILYGSDMGRKIATFNHSKIVAGDGTYAVVGGHNMCEEVSSNRAPVIHDITCEVTGPGARSANAFAGSLWLKAAESGRLWIHKFNWAKAVFDDIWKDSSKKWAPDNWSAYELGDQAEVPKVIKNQHWFYDMSGLPHRNKQNPPDNSVRATAVLGVGRWGDTKVFGVDGASGLKLNAPLTTRFACHYTCDFIKRMMIRDQENTLIRMSQQDLINTGFFGRRQASEHTICQELGHRLRMTKKNTAIQVVVSSRFSQNSQGLAYSYGDGPREAAEMISDSVVGEKHASSKIKELPARLATLALSVKQESAPSVPVDPSLSYCTVAPLAFCNAVGTSRDRGSYVWPDAKYQTSMGEKAYTNGRFYNDDDKAELAFGPGNHSKVICVSKGDDDSTGMVLIGSDNMYPSPLSEFSFVIEGPEAIKAWREQYWDNLWGYSARLGFTVVSNGTVV